MGAPAKGAVHLSLLLGSEAVPYGAALPFFLIATVRRLELEVSWRTPAKRLAIANCRCGTFFSQCPRQSLVSPGLNGTQAQGGCPRKEFGYPLSITIHRCPMRYRIVRWFRDIPEIKEPAVQQIFVARGVAERAKARLAAGFPDCCFAVEETAAQFELGALVVAPDALEAIEDAGQTAMEFFSRHALGSLEDMEAVGAASRFYLTSGLRISSYHKTRKNVGLSIVTEVDRLMTTISVRNGD